MSNSKATKDTKKTVERTEEMSRKIWLAGLGAYGQSLDNLHTGYEKMSDHAREYFEELVARGEKLENDTRSGISSARSKIKSQTEKNREMLNRQIAELREKVSATSLHKDELLEELQGRVTKLTETLNKLIPAREKSTPAKKPAKPAKKNTSAAKPARKTATAAKSTAQKTGTRKTAAGKTTTRRKAPAAPKSA